MSIPVIHPYDITPKFEGWRWKEFLNDAKKDKDMSYEKENLTREKAMILMIEGKKIRHDKIFLFEDSYYFYEKGRFWVFDAKTSKIHERAGLNISDGYYVFEPKPEPRFKEVTMYAPILRHSIMTFAASGMLYKDPETLFKSGGGIIGYTEVKVFLKENQ